MGGRKNKNGCPLRCDEQRLGLCAFFVRSEWMSLIFCLRVRRFTSLQASFVWMYVVSTTGRHITDFVAMGFLELTTNDVLEIYVATSLLHLPISAPFLTRRQSTVAQYKRLIIIARSMPIVRFFPFSPSRYYVLFFVFLGTRVILPANKLLFPSCRFHKYPPLV